MSRGVAYFNSAIKNGEDKLANYFLFMNPESPSAPRVVKLRLINNAYRLFHT